MSGFSLHKRLFAKDPQPTGIAVLLNNACVSKARRACRCPPEPRVVDPAPPGADAQIVKAAISSPISVACVRTTSMKVRRTTDAVSGTDAGHLLSRR